MRIRVHFYSYFKELAGSPLLIESMPPGSSVADLLDSLASRFPKLAAVRGSTLVAVGADYQGPTYRLKEQDEVSLFPPVQGG